MTDRASEASLAEALRGGDPAALAKLIELYRPVLHRMVSLRLDRRIRQRVSPSDVLQQSFLEAGRRLPRYADQQDVSPLLWLRWIVCQHMIDLHRRHLAEKRDATLELPLERGPWQAASSDALVAVLVSRQQAPEDLILQRELTDRVGRVLEGMDPMDREILTLRHFEELSNGEAAEILGLKASAASKRYVRALERFRVALDAVRESTG